MPTPRTRPGRASRVAALALATLVLATPLGACGGGSDDADGTTTSPARSTDSTDRVDGPSTTISDAGGDPAAFCQAYVSLDQVLTTIQSDSTPSDIVATLDAAGPALDQLIGTSPTAIRDKVEVFVAAFLVYRQKLAALDPASPTYVSDGQKAGAEVFNDTRLNEAGNVMEDYRRQACGSG